MSRRTAISAVVKIWALTAALEKFTTFLSSSTDTCGVTGSMHAARCHLHNFNDLDKTRKAAQAHGDT